MSESKSKAPNGRLKVSVKLLGKDGNAFYILGTCMKAMRRAGWNREEVEEFSELCMVVDYDNLLRVVMEYCEVD